MNSTFDGNAVRKEEAVEDGKVTPMPVQKTETKKKPAKAAAKAETAEVPEMEESKKHSACSEPSYVYRALQWIQCNLKLRRICITNSASTTTEMQRAFWKQ